MDMKKRMGVVAVLAVVMFGTAASAAPVTPGNTPKEAHGVPTETITLKPGEVKNLPAKGAIRAAIGDSDIAEISVDRSSSTSSSTLSFLLTGGEVGKTTLILWFGDKTSRTYEIIVQG
jgi:putative type II/III system pilus formation protein